MLRKLALILLLVASTGPALAIDPSGLEDTDCLKACDSNQEHCMVPGRVTAPTYSPVERSSFSKIKSPRGVPPSDVRPVARRDKPAHPKS